MDLARCVVCANMRSVDPPFFQKETDSSNEDKSYQQHLVAPAKLTTAQSSSADEYRSVIDDLTVEIQKLKDELKRYKQKGPDTLRKDKLFEIKIHGLPKRKKRELESTLRDFAASLQSSPDASSSQRKKQSSRHANRNHMYSGSGSMSKHASSSSGSYNRPVDSAYASMSTGAHSSGASLGRPSMSSRVKSSEQKVESYLRDIPEGLYPRNVMMTDKEKKKIVVRRLEQLFTGKIGGRHFKRSQQPPSAPNSTTHLAPVVAEGQSQQLRPLVHQPPTLGNSNSTNEPSREAKILPVEQNSRQSKKSRSRDNGSASNSGGDQTESGGNGNSSGGTNPSPPNPPPPEQRPTRLTDLDPDRVQVPSENMEYIKHLGLVPPELLTDPAEDVHPDAEGWVYLNLLCNMAQLHMINVTPDFVRAAVSGISAKFQLSPDGRKIRWRGGSDGTKFSSDSSGENGQNSPDTDASDGSNKEESRKRQKTGHSTGDEIQSGGSSRNASKFGPQVSGSSESFHYKPLFVHQTSSQEQTSMDETLSSFGPVEDSNIDDSRWGQSGSGGTSSRRKRRRDGAIIYYSGAPFCTDLSGDPGDASPMTYMMSSGQGQQEGHNDRPSLFRSHSGSSLSYRPLTDKVPYPEPVSKMDIDSIDMPGLSTDSGGDSADDLDFDVPWSDQQQYMKVHPLEPCGLGGVMPEDHFMVVVTTNRPKGEIGPSVATGQKSRAEETTDSIIGRLASMRTSSPAPLASTATSKTQLPVVEIEYTSGRIKRLAPVRLPPPAIFFPPFSSDCSSSEGDMFGSEGDDELGSSDESSSRQANLHCSDGYPDGVDLSSGDEDGEDPDDEPDTRGMYDDEGFGRPRLTERRRQSSAEAAAGTSARDRSKSASAEPTGRTDRSSAATAGGAVSGDSSGDISS